MTNLTDTEKLCGLKRADFQTTINGKSTDLFFLKNNAGNVVAIKLWRSHRCYHGT